MVAKWYYQKIKNKNKNKIKKIIIKIYFETKPVINQTLLVMIMEEIKIKINDCFLW